MKEFIIDEKDIKQLTELKGGCIVSNKITKEGYKVGYMYRENPSNNFCDSGWRFFAGDETEEYCNDSNNFNIFELNTVCNYDISIEGKLEAPVGSSFIKVNDEFVEDYST